MRQLSCVTLLVLLTACQRPLSGRYVLVSINGAQVPTGIAAVPGDTLWVYEGSIEFRAADELPRTRGGQRDGRFAGAAELPLRRCATPVPSVDRRA